VNLRNKILLFSMAPVLIVMSLVAGLGVVEVREQLIASQKEQIRGELKNAARVIGRDTKEALAVTRLIARSQETGLLGRREESIQMAREILETNPGFVGVSTGYEPNVDGGDAAWLARVGANHASTDGTGRFLPYWYRDSAANGELKLEPLVEMDTALYYDGLRRQFASNPSAKCMVTEPYIYNERNLIVEHTCAIEVDGKFAGMTGVDRSLETLSEYLLELKPVDASELLLISSRGRIIATSFQEEGDEGLRTIRLQDLYLQAGDQTQFALDLYRIEDGKKVIDSEEHAKGDLDKLDRSFQTAMQAVMAAAETGEVIDVYMPLTGKTELGSAQKIPSGDWTLVLLVASDHVTGAVRSTVIRVALVAIFGMAIVAWLLMRLANTMSRRIAAVGATARTVADGDVCDCIVVESTDETGQLQEAIRDMVSGLAGLITQVKRSSIRLMSAAREIAAGIRQQETAIEEFGNATGEIATASTQISGSSSGLLKTMGGLSNIAAETAALAGEGRKGLAGMASTVSRLDGSTRGVSERLATISEKAGNINVVVTTIVKVADQTNLLSLNAAVEAKKAGERGRGFTVVAQEIRRLADQTAEATLDIESMVGEMQTAVSSGVMEMDKFTEEARVASSEVERAGAKLEKIIGQVQELTESFRLVTEGMDSQAEGARQIRDALVTLSEGANRSSESLKSYRNVGENLSQSVEGLRQEIARFKTGDTQPGSGGGSNPA
jgi:methyl-accepting chemotaxis protein WspA